MCDSEWIGQNDHAHLRLPPVTYDAGCDLSRMTNRQLEHLYAEGGSTRFH
jgi:hypothetical protein